MASGWLAAGKLLRALLHALAGWWTIVLRFPRLSDELRARRVQVWAVRMLAILDIRLQVRGPVPAAGPLLLVANHISWLDILVLHAARHCRFVAKADVRHWPLIGTLATGAGTLYIERASRRDAMRVVHHMADALRGGDLLAVFPEGTTSDGSGLLPFHANLLQAAISAAAPVQPDGLAYLDDASGAVSLAPRYVDEESLAASLWRTLRAGRLRAVVQFGLAEQAAGRDRRAWSAALRVQVDALRRSGR